MPASILKVGLTALIGTSLVGTFYFEMMLPRPDRFDAESPGGEFKWTLPSVSLPEGRSTLKPLAFESGDQSVRKADFRASSTGPREAEQPEAGGHAFLASLLPPAGLHGEWALHTTRPAEVFESLLAGNPPGGPSNPPTDVPGIGPIGGNPTHPADPLLDASITSAPEPGTLALLAAGVAALGLVGLKRRKVSR